ncbi:porin family protein [Hymenobacter cavernae]|uniref:porin family protein n=1 Tax=Hymenobacter cavernae TaxID=2044852 RepID=UPI001667A904|nr:porin family protein [Hymenobacter cavernae]
MKHCLLAFLFPVITSSAEAQNTPSFSTNTDAIATSTAAAPTAKQQAGTKPAVRFGAKLGLNVSNTNFNRGFPKPATSIETTWKPGAVVGLFVQVPFSQKLSLQQEYLFSQMGGKVKSTGTEYRFNYLSLPVLLKYSLTPRFGIALGPQFDLLLQAKQKINGASTTITHDTEERSISATAGAEFYVLDNLSLNLRYLYGLNHVGLSQRSGNPTEFKYEMAQLSATVTF